MARNSRIHELRRRAESVGAPFTLASKRGGGGGGEDREENSLLVGLVGRDGGRSVARGESDEGETIPLRADRSGSTTASSIRANILSRYFLVFALKNKRMRHLPIYTYVLSRIHSHKNPIRYSMPNKLEDCPIFQQQYFLILLTDQIDFSKNTRLPKCI